MSRGGLTNTGSNGGGGGGGTGGSGYRGLRDYGATSSTSSTNNLPEVDFAGFSPTEFISLSENIGHNIGSVKSSWQTLEKTIKIIGTNKDNLAVREKVHQIQIETNKKIQTTSKDLQRLSVVVRRGDKQQKLQVEKLTSDFKTIVEMYSTSQKQIASKMKAIILSNASQNDDLLLSEGDLHRQQQPQTTSADEAYLQQNLQKQQHQNLQFEQSMMLEREQRVRDIENVVLDVNQIMRDLSVLINQQGESIDTIESGIDHTAGNIENGTSELIKAAQSQAKYRRRVLILVIIAVIIGIIVTSIIVSQLKS